MAEILICCVQNSDAVRHAAKYLSQLGLKVTEDPGKNVTHLLLPVPSFPQGDGYLAQILEELPEDVQIFGGNLSSPLLDRYRCVDLLQDPRYLADNAAITADCALGILESKMELKSKNILILGWGRIGKCLGKRLQARGADVSIAARKETDLAMLHALGYRDVPISQVSLELSHYQAILNTVPEMILPKMQVQPGTLVIELASKPGMAGCEILQARGLPGRMDPARSGKLMAESMIRLL